MKTAGFPGLVVFSPYSQDELRSGAIDFIDAAPKLYKKV